MAQFKAGVIGCGGRGKGHARGWVASEDVELVACADPFEESRTPYMSEFGVARGYEDYREMLEKEDLDFVSVCTWIRMHHDMIVDVAKSGVRAIHSEKPIAPTWGEAKSLYQTCVDNDVVITFCHQRRFEKQFVKAKQLLKSGAIGDLYRLEGNCPNLFDWGTHWFDMFFFYNDDIPAEWVMGQIDARGGREVFGVPVEGSGLSWIRYQNGVEGLLATGGTNVQHMQNRLVGTEGVIEVIGGRDNPPLRMFSKSEWTEPSLDDMDQTNATTTSVLDLVDAIKSGREPELSGRRAMAATELIFSTYESSRRRARIDLPLDVDDSALLTMLEDGSVTMDNG
jgi:UDP-N-acetylglucosamine 3-dehydrogenase